MVSGSAAAAVSAGSSAKTMAAAITEDFVSTGVKATAVTYALINDLSALVLLTLVYKQLTELPLLFQITHQHLI